MQVCKASPGTGSSLLGPTSLVLVQSGYIKAAGQVSGLNLLQNNYILIL